MDLPNHREKSILYFKNALKIKDDKNKGFGFIMYASKKIFFHISDCKFDNPIKNKQVLFQKD